MGTTPPSFTHISLIDQANQAKVQRPKRQNSIKILNNNFHLWHLAFKAKNMTKLTNKEKQDG